MTAPFSPPMSPQSSGLIATGGSAYRGLADRFGDFANVKDFGAKGDGVTNDSIAFQAAINSGKNVYVPGPMTYIVGDLFLSGSLQSLFTERAILQPATGATTLIKLQGFNNSVRGFYVNDLNGATTSQTTLASAAATNATTIVVASAVNGPGILLNQRIAIRLDSGSYFTTWVSSVSGNTIGLLDPLPSSASAGLNVWSTLGLVYVQNAIWWRLRDLTFNGVWGGISLDDPSLIGSNAGVSKGSIENIRFTGTRIFGVIKGRNCPDNNFRDVQIWGGWSTAAAAVGDGSTTVFALPEAVCLIRELTVKVNGIVQTVGTSYTIAANGLSVAFTAAPAAGAAISFGYQVYGAEGFVDDGRGGAVVGGNNYFQLSVLGARRGIVLKQAQLYSFDQIISDTISEACVIADATVSTGQFTNAFLGWGPIQISAVNGAIGLKLSGTSTPISSSYPVSGMGGVLASIASGSTPDIFVKNNGGGSTEYRGGVLSESIDSSGNIGFGVMPTGIGKFVIGGSQGNIAFPATGIQLNFGYQGYNYITALSTGASLALEATAGIYNFVGGNAILALKPASATFSAVPVNLSKLAAAPSAPGAGLATLFVTAGTTSGTCKLQMIAGTSATAVTIADNIGAGF